ncbi:hypothetical protein [Bacillus sp. GM_Baccil_2]|uniref:hypothetical protein n=1 Tax=Bacillus sp. GM_Baccil_2 TaxID=2937369 RepID=UPI002269EB34
MKKVLVSILSLFLCFTVFGASSAAAAESTHFKNTRGVGPGDSYTWKQKIYLKSNGDVEIVAVQYSDDTTDVNVEYTLINVDSKNEESDAIDGTYKGKSKILKFKNVKKGTYKLKITNHSDEVVYGNFYAYY